MKNTKKKGFTLIELIVVIAILGILAAILIPKFGGFTAKADKSACLADARTILTSYNTIVTENTKLVLDTTSPGSDIKDLTGDLKGEIKDPLNTDGKISFKYTRGGWTVTCTDGALGDPSK